MRTAILAAALFLTTSPLFAQADAEQVQRRHKGTSPNPGETRTVSVGEVVFEEVDQTEYLWAELRSDIVASGQGVILKKGSLLWGSKAEGTKREFCDIDLPGQFCFTDEDGNGTLDKARVVGGSRIPSLSARYTEYWKPVKPEEGRKDDHRWELVYLGAGGGVLRFSAREYLDDPARPSTQNEVTYDLKPGEPTSLTFRGVKLEVLETGNDGIKYRVVAEE
jgi:hypothetical protein